MNVNPTKSIIIKCLTFNQNISAICVHKMISDAVQSSNHNQKIGLKWCIFSLKWFTLSFQCVKWNTETHTHTHTHARKHSSTAWVGSVKMVLWFDLLWKFVDANGYSFFFAWLCFVLLRALNNLATEPTKSLSLPVSQTYRFDFVRNTNEY